MEKASGKTFEEEMQKGMQQGMQNAYNLLLKNGIPSAQAKRMLQLP
jgi:hypothetical protein